MWMWNGKDAKIESFFKLEDTNANKFDSWDYKKLERRMKEDERTS